MWFFFCSFLVFLVFVDFFAWFANSEFCYDFISHFSFFEDVC